MLNVRVIGGITASAHAGEIPPPASRRSLALLGWLALHPGLHSRAEIAGCLWPDVPDSSGRQSLRSALWSLRASLEPSAPGALVTSRDHVGLCPDVDVDVLRFQAQLFRGDLEEAVAEGGGNLLAGLDDEWVLVAREEHRQRLVNALLDLSTRAADIGELAASVRWCRQALAVDPLSEESGRALMQRLSEAGDRAAALAVYRRLAERLRRELRVAPSEMTWQLAERVRLTTDSAKRVTVSAVRGSGDGKGREHARSGSSRAGVAPLVGRADELGQLRRAWTDACDGRGGLVVVRGEPGIGKTRLVHELMQYASRDGARTAVGQAADAAGPPMQLWAEIAACLVDDLEADGASPPGAISALTAVASEAPESAAGSPPYFAAARISEAMSVLVERSSRSGPLLVVLEDMHAADEASVGVLSFVARRLPRTCVLFVVTRRERPRRDGLAALEHTQYQRGELLADVHLMPLPPAAVARIARSSGVVEAAGIERVVSAAEGNALLAVEAARAITAGRTPIDGLAGAVRAAMARLPVASRELVSTVAVAGRDLELAEAAGRSGVDVLDALPAAEEEGLLACDGYGVGFRHALLRDAAYADLPPAERHQRHASAAAWLQTNDGMDRAAETARHLQASGASAHAGRLLLQAARRARRVGALADATVLLTQATTLLPDDPEPALERADALAWRGRPADAREAFDTALAMLEIAGDPLAVAAAHLRFVEWHVGPNCQPWIAAEGCRRALRVLDAAGVTAAPLRAQVLAVFAWYESLTGASADVERLLAELAVVTHGLPFDPVLESSVAMTRSLSLLRQGRFEDAVEPGLEAARLAEKAYRPDLVYSALVNVAFGLAAVGDMAQALALLDQISDAVHEQGMVAIEALVRIDRAWVLVRLGRAADATEAVAQARRCADRLDGPDLQALVDAEWGRVALYSGDHEVAERRLASALAVPDVAIGRPLARLQRAEALARLGRLTEAQEEVGRMVLEPVRAGDWPDTLVARMAGVQGLIAAASGDRVLARRRFDEAIKGWRRRFDHADLAKRMTAVMVDLGRPIIGLIVPAEELARVQADRDALAVEEEGVHQC